MLYTLLAGYLPFDGEKEHQTLQKVSMGQYDMTKNVWVNISEDAKRFIRRMLEMDTTKRYSAEEAFNDPWIKKIVRTYKN